jgi:hypothetical protein
VEKRCSARQATDDKLMRIACWIPKAANMLEIYCFFTATVVVQMCLNVVFTYVARHIKCWMIISRVKSMWVDMETLMPGSGYFSEKMKGKLLVCEGRASSLY